MKNQEIKNEHQVILFQTIQQTLPDKSSLVYVLSDLLGVGIDATYRRIRGEKPISFEEAVKLCKHFQISLDSLADVSTDNNYIRCRYVPLNLTSQNQKDYFSFLQVFSDNLESFRSVPENEIILSALDIPLFNLFPYKELTLFKLFSWSKCVYGYTATFETFAEEAETTGLFNIIHEKIVRNYQLVPSTEIWTTSTTNTILRLLNYHFEMEHFSDIKSLLLLCDQLLNLINTLKNWTETGVKGSKAVPYKFFISETDIGNTFILFKKTEGKSCMVRLYTINGLSISDERFCGETENWLRNLARRSTLISGVSEVERFKFFDGENRKIRHLIEKIQSNMGK